MIETPLFPIAVDEDAPLPPPPFRPIIAPPPLPPRRRGRRLLKRGALYGASTLLVVLAAVAGWAYLQYRDLNAAVGQLRAGPKAAVVKQAQQELNVQPKHSLSMTLQKREVNPLTQAELAQTQTILVVGSDRRWGEGGGRSDTIMLVRVNPSLKTVSILSIPRDLRVPIPGHGYDKVNAAFSYGGDRLLIATLRDYLGVPINHFVETNFHGFGQLVDVLGGVYLPVDGRYYNKNVGTASTDFADIDLQPGYQRLDATQALQFVRFRHFDSDFYRAARQQLFLREVERQVVADKYDVNRMSRLIHAFTKNTASDISSLSEIWRLANAVRATPPDRVVREVLPASDLMLDSVYYLQVDTPQKDAALSRWFDPRGRIRAQNIATATLAKRPQAGRQATAAQSTAVTDSSLVSDGGRGLSLVKALRFPAPYCGLSELPRGYWWGSEEPMRAYTLAGHPALAGWVTAGSGRSVLLMETTWSSPPVLSHPTRAFRRGGRAYQVWTDSGTIRQVAWRMGPTVAWLTNTLRNELSARQMLALAAGCQATY